MLSSMFHKTNQASLGFGSDQYINSKLQRVEYNQEIRLINGNPKTKDQQDLTFFPCKILARNLIQISAQLYQDSCEILKNFRRNKIL